MATDSTGFAGAARSAANRSTYHRRHYAVTTTADAKQITNSYLADVNLAGLAISLGLPEVDDRYHVWRVPLLSAEGQRRIGEVVIDARTSVVQSRRSTDPAILLARIFDTSTPPQDASPRRKSTIARSELRNTIIQGDSEHTLPDLPAGAVDLVFTSPPYFNARPDYTEYSAYGEYLAKLGRIIRQCERLLAEGRFFVINIAPVLLRREHRNRASRRLAVPFDLHAVITNEGFDFIDDIIWQKPAGAGWATGRGRRFAADRQPLQYKAVPVTEYVLVYRKHTDQLIDWNIRNHPDQQAVADSKIDDDYERTNVWSISPASTPQHPAVFPRALADRVIQYYSFKNDVVLDPFAGSGTVGESCVSYGRRFVLAEMSPTYVDVIKQNAIRWLGKRAEDVHCINTTSIRAEQLL